MDKYNEYAVELIMNPNYPDHSIFRIEQKLGTSWLTDKYRHTLVGGVVNKTVFAYGESYNEDTDEVEDWEIRNTGLRINRCSH